MRLRRYGSMVAVAALATGALAAGAPAATAAAQPESLTTLSSHSIRVTSSTGRHLTLKITAIRHSDSTTTSDRTSPGTLSIVLTNKSKVESHTWEFPLSGGTFTTTRKGNGSLRTGTQLAPFGRVSFTITRRTPATRLVCDNANFQVAHTVKLTGKLRLDTKSTGAHAWGVVKHRLTFKHATLTGDHGPDSEEACAKPFPCAAGLSWMASDKDLAHNDVTLSGTTRTGAAKGHLRANRFVALDTPAGADRLDEVAVTAPRLLISSGKKPTLTIQSSGKVATGAATITAKHSSAYQQSCKGGHQDQGTTYTGTYTLADVGLSFSEQVFGPIALSTVQNATFNDVHTT